MEDTGRLLTAGRTGANRKRLILAVATVALIAAIGVAGVFLVKDRKYNEQIAIAEKCLQEGDYAGAEAGYASAVSMNRRREKGHKGLAYTYVLEEKYADASNTYTQLYEMTNEEVYRTAAEETSSGMPPTDPELFPSDDLWIKVSEGQVPDAGGMTHFMDMFNTWSVVFARQDKSSESVPVTSFDSGSPEMSYAFPASMAYFTRNEGYNIYPEYVDACEYPNSDPKGWADGNCQRIKKDVLDTVYSDLFNVDKDKIPGVLAEMEKRGIMYLDNDYYYQFLYGRGLDPVESAVSRVWINNSRCLVEYEAYATENGPVRSERPDIGTYYAVMELKEVNGSRQWTMLYNGKEPPEELKDLLSAGSDTEPADTGGMEILQEINGVKFILTSGVGGWDNTLTISPDGSFRGLFHDSNAGDDLAPNLYCSYEGKIGSVEKINDYEYDLIVKGDLKLDEQHGSREVKDGMVTEYCDPYGLENVKDGSRIRLLMPGYQTSGLSDDAQSWIRMRGDDVTASLNRHGIYNRTQETEYLFLQ